MNNRLLLMQVLYILLLTTCSFSLSAQPLVVDVDHPKFPINQAMWGIFFEDINFAADGGIYAEMVKNRSFDFFNPLTGWKVKSRSKDSSAFIVLNRSGQNPRFVQLTVDKENEPVSLTNSGFRGMGFRKNHRYLFSILAAVPTSENMHLTVSLLDSTGKSIGETSLVLSGSEWKKYSVPLSAEATNGHGNLQLSFETKGKAYIDLVSLFPEDTWKNRPEGLRADLVQLLADLNPGFIRFPGGCIVEGRELSTRYEWKNTIGSIENRTFKVNRWNTEFKHRLTPDYFQTFGLGFYEYFLLAEDIGAEPLPILNCGMACQFNTAEVVALDELDPYIQDALDLIEFANGPADSKWGKIRSEMGHPESFHLKMIGIGNEQWGPQYFERYRLFEKAILAKYPDMKLILGAGPSPNGDLFDFAWNELKNIQPQIVDEHYYSNPEWFLANAKRYDSYQRGSHKIFAGEYAAQSVAVCSPENQNNWKCALSEAAFMTGLERNADVVTMCSYAPLFAHTEGWQWKPDLIWFDNLSSFGTPNYYVQNLFSNNRGSQVLDVKMNNSVVAGEQGLYASAAWDNKNGEIILKVVNSTGKPVQKEIDLHTEKNVLRDMMLIRLQCDDPGAVNSLSSLKIKPEKLIVPVKGKKFSFIFEPYSLNVIRIKQK